jgi:hypothetical protein
VRKRLVDDDGAIERRGEGNGFVQAVLPGSRISLSDLAAAVARV